MSKVIAIVFLLTVSACSDRLLDATVLKTYPKDGTIQVWIPDHEEPYTINVGDFAGGVVPESALTCPSLVDLSRISEESRFYFTPPTVGEYGVNVWTLKGCEGLNEFQDHELHPDVWVMPSVTRDPAFQWMIDALTEYNDCSLDDSCDAYTDGGYPREYRESDACIADARASGGSPDIDCERWENPGE